MGLGKFLKDLVSGQPPVVGSGQAQRYTQIQQQTARGMHAASFRRVCVVSPSNEVKLFLHERLKPLIEQEQYVYNDNPSVSECTNSSIVIVDATPKAHAMYHDQYDKILRIKKSMGKIHDMYCAFGPRKDYKKYPRGTYPNMYYFCIVEGDLEHRDPDLPLEGLDTVEGPRLFNFADIGQAILNRIRQPQRKP